MRFADEAYAIGPAPAAESYLNVGAILEAARQAGADAVHPGYGFLAENAGFAEACAGAGIVFVGPPPSAMRAVGEKTAARRLARDVDVPVVPGALEATTDVAAITRIASEIGYPIVLKAAAGGGGKGMRIVERERDLRVALRGAMGEARGAFGDPALYVEKLVRGARHVEMQFVADARGKVVWLGERDCSVQRRHQKLIEETPAPAVDDALRERLGEYAVRVARRAGYVNAGTAEFLVDAAGAPHFLEVNARLQVEHPLTEAVTGLDLVKLQLLIASGEALPFAQGDVAPRGAAIECRISAEDPEESFTPWAGTIAFAREPAGPGIRVDSSLFAGMVVPTEYDPLLAKVVAWGRDRAEAVARMRRALAEMAVAGVRTTLPFHQYVLDEPDFASGNYDLDYTARHWPARQRVEADGAVAAAYAGVLARRHAGSSLVAPPPSAWRRAAREDAVQ